MSLLEAGTSVVNSDRAVEGMISGAGVWEGAAGSACSMNSSVPNPRKLRRKRRDLDALVTEKKTRRKSSSEFSRRDLIRDSDSSDEPKIRRRNSKRNSPPYPFSKGCAMGGCGLMLLASVAIAILTSFKLLITARTDIDELLRKMNSVESGNSEFPAKFHEFRVRLQLLENNHSTLTSTMTKFNLSLSNISDSVSKLQSGLMKVQNKINQAAPNPNLSLNVSSIESSVGKFGLSLLDISSSVKVLQEGLSDLKKSVAHDHDQLKALEIVVTSVQNASYINNAKDTNESHPVSEAVLKLNSDFSYLNTSISRLNEALLGSANEVSNYNSSNFTRPRMFTGTLPESLENISTKIREINEKLSTNSENMESMNQSIAVVKGVEKKLEGSQLQLASGVSELRSKLKKLGEEISVMKTPISTSTAKSSDEIAVPNKQKRGVQSRTLRGYRKQFGYNLGDN